MPMLIVTSYLHEDSHSQQGTLFLWALVSLRVKKKMIPGKHIMLNKC